MAWTPPGTNVTDMDLARLSFYTGQLLLAGSVDARSLVSASLEWHGTSANGDPEVPSFVMVNTAGPLVDLVGERLRISFGGRSVYAYCHKASPEMDDDLSVTRQLFLRLATLDTTSLDVSVEVLR